MAVSFIAGTKQALDQRLQPLVSQPAVQIREELFFFARTHVESSNTMMSGEWPLRQKMFVVLLNRLADIAQTVRGNHKRQVVFVLHQASLVSP